MCGFAGFIDVESRIPTDQRLSMARRMGAAIESRGPDDSGVHDEGEAGLVLAFRRLAILDLTAAGHQPMISASGRCVMVFNGEVYNSAELASDLRAAGAHLRGHSDTEAILESFERWGVEAVLPRLRGMFAIAFYDRRTRLLVLLRDRLGKKPLYYAQGDGAFLFASQVKSFAAHPAWRPELDRRSLAAYMRFGYVPAPMSIYAGVACLRPGERIDIHDGKIVGKAQYWDLRERSFAARGRPLELSDREAIDRLEEHLRASISERMISDVPLGAFLSGGVDSSAVAALMQASSVRKIKTFSIGFEEGAYDESKYAAAVARHLGTDHRELIVTAADALDVIPKIPDFFDEPFADASQVPTYLLCKMTREHVTVALSGDGGDELFAGYARYRLAGDVLGAVDAVPRRLRPWLASAIRSMPPNLWSLVAPLVPERFGRSSLSGRAARFADLLDVGGEEKVLQNIVGQWPDPEAVVLGSTYSDDPIWAGSLSDVAPERLRRFQLIDALTYLPDDILVKVDRASMAVSLEARTPLLDHRIVDFSLQLPQRFLVRGAETKWLLRQVLYRHVPRHLIERPKAGFMMPIDAWLRGPLRDWAEDLLDARALEQEGIFNPQPIRDMWKQHLSGQIDWQYRLWCVLMFQAWKRRWLDRPISAA